MLLHSTVFHHPLHDENSPAEDWFSAQGFLDLYTENGQAADAVGEPAPAYHLGEDLNFGNPGDDANQEVYAVGTGTIVKVGNYGAGDYVVVAHEAGGQTFSAVYGHIDIADGLGVDSDLVWGQQIGTLHDYSADHLHFAVAEGTATGVTKGYTDAATRASATIGPDGVEYVFENELGVTKFLDPIGFFETYGAEPYPVGGVPSTTSFAEAAGDFGVADGSDVAELYLASIFGDAISNVTYTGSESAAFLVSDFEIPGVDIDLEGGILLSSGGFPGPSNTESAFTVEHGTAGDDDLFEVVTAAFPAAGSTQDAAVLEFDIFIDDPDVEGIRFDIVFGSDEYSEFSNSDFVDVAAVWVDDDRDGDFEPDENKALFNGNPNTPLSIIDDNLSFNLVDNEIGEVVVGEGEYPIEWDGFGQLVARPSLQLGQNSIKIAVADTGDQELDSGIYVTNFELLTGGATSNIPLNVLNGQVGENDLGASEDREEINLAEGPGSVSGTLAELSGDVITGFDSVKSLLFEAIELLRSQLDVLGGSAVLQVDSDQDGTVDGTVTLEGDFTDGDFMAVRDDGNTLVTFETFLPELQERQAVEPDLVNGIINQNFLKGDGTTDFQVTLRDLGFAGYDNVLGVCEIDATGNIVDTQILFENANADKAASVLIEDVEDGHNLGFFIVPDAADWAATLAAGDTLSFVNSSGAAANVSDGADISIAVNGAVADEMVFHSFDEDMNADGLQHALSGVEVGGEAITVGFEDLTGGGDRDYEDVAFRVELVDNLPIV